MSHETPPTCSDCRTPLEVDGICLSCLLHDALVAGDTTSEGEFPNGGFGSFVPQEVKEFGKYTLRHKIGSGGMGIIWEAEESVVRRVVALKMIRGFVFSTEADKLRFRTEATAAAQLDHPNIVPVYELGEVDSQPYFTMKLLGGDNLSSRLKKGALSTRDTARIMEKLARAVQHAHTRGVLHRDLKPGNVLFDDDGEPYITDFGLAKLVDAGQGLTLSNAQVGTPLYMSPEQARGQTHDVTTASDLWALGAMFYQMLTGQVPFPGSTSAEIFHRVVYDDPVTIRTLTASSDSDLETLCLRCLEKEPTRRLSAGELADELGRWLRGELIRSRRITGRERALRWMLRHPWRVAAVSALVLFLLIGSVVSLLLWRQAETSREQATRYAAAERFTGYVSTLSATLAARERHDLSRARQLLASAPEEHRGLEWRLLDQFCTGDESALFRLPGGEIPETLALGPDGKSLAIVSDKGMLHVCAWDGRQLRPPRLLPQPASDQDLGHATPQNFHSLLYSPDGKHFTCSFRNTVRVFDAETLEVILERDNLVQVRSVWLDERRLLFGLNISIVSSRTLGAWIFDTQDRSLRPLPQGMYAPFAVSADSGLTAVTEQQSRSVAVFRIADFASTEPLKNVTPVARWYPRASRFGNVLTLSPDGKYLAALCGRIEAPAHTLEISELATGKVLMTQTFREAMTGLVFHPKEPLVALAGSDAVVRLFHFLYEMPPGPPAYDDDIPAAMRELIDGNGAHSPPRRLLTRTASGGRAVFLLGHEGKSTEVLFTPDGASLYSSAADGTVRIWLPQAPEPGMRVKNVHLHNKLGLYPSVSPDGSRLLFFDHDRNTHYWREGKGFTRLAEGHMPLAVLPAGQLATMERKSSDIILWQEDDDTDSIQETGRIPGPGYIQEFDNVLRGLSTHDGSKIVGALPGQVFVVDIKARTTATTGDKRWETGPSRKWDIAVSPDGRHIAVTGLGHCAAIYDSEDLSKPPVILGKFRNYDTAVTYHPDGSRLYCGNEDGRVRVFDTSDWTELPEQGWQAHRSAVIAMTVSNDAQIIATAGDTTLKLWQAEKTPAAAHTEMLSFTTPSPAAWLHFGRDETGKDRSLMLCPPSGPLEIWPCPLSPDGGPGPTMTSSTRVIRVPQRPLANAPGSTFRLKAYSIDGGQKKGEYFLAYSPRDNTASREAEVIIRRHDDTSGVIIELTMVKGPKGSIAFKVHNFPPPEDKDVSNMSAYLVCRDDGRLVVTYRLDERLHNPNDPALFVPHSAFIDAEDTREFRSLRSLFLPGHYLRHTSYQAFLVPRDTSNTDMVELYNHDATWGYEPTVPKANR